MCFVNECACHINQRLQRRIKVHKLKKIEQFSELNFTFLKAENLLFIYLFIQPTSFYVTIFILFITFTCHNPSHQLIPLSSLGFVKNSAKSFRSYMKVKGGK